MSRDPPASVEVSLERIANYLERIADALEGSTDGSAGDSLRQLEQHAASVARDVKGSNDQGTLLTRR